MSISILNRGASGGLKPELTVTAPSGSTIDLLQNGIIIDTYTLGAEETEHTFVVKVGTYTARGTLGEDAAEIEVVIDVVGRYEVTIAYDLWLYNQGDEHEDVTGGWTSITHTATSFWTAGGMTKNETSISLSSGIRQYIAAKPQNTIDVTNYTKVICVVDSRTGSGTYDVAGISIRKSLSDMELVADASVEIPYGTTGEVTLDISSIKGSVNILIEAHSQSTTSTIQFSGMYLTN